MLSPWFGASRAFNEMDALRREMDALFRTYDADYGEVGVGPVVRMTEDDEAWTVFMDVPGLTAEDVEVTVQASRLTVQGIRRLAAPEGYQAHRRERREWRLARSFRLPSRVEADAVTAEVKEGVLSVRLPKAPELKPRQISVQSA